jgi:signal transduction histidine kinase
LLGVGAGQWFGRGTFLAVSLAIAWYGAAKRRAQNRLVSEIEQRKQAEARTVSQNERLHLLNETAARLLAVAEPEQAMIGVYQQIARYFQTCGFFEFEAGEALDRLRLSLCLAVGQPEQECGITEVRMGEGIVGLVAERRTPMYLGHVQDTENPNAQMIKRLGIRAYVCCPLVVGGRLLGTLSFASRQRDSFEPEDQEFFQTLASYLAMAKEHRRLAHALELHAANLESTVEDRTANLREMIAELEHMSYSMIHDMRAPLRAIQGFATLIERFDAERLSPQSRDLFSRVLASATRMDQLITDALNYNRTVRTKLPLGPVETGELIEGIVKSYPEFQADRADIRLEGDFPRVVANSSGLTQCFSNLLGNAVKFVAPGQRPQIKVSAERLGERARIWFEDNGTGIPQEGLGRIFDMFQRMHGPEYEGTGIGLALVRKVTERMGGHVGVESEEGKGSRFWVEFALAHGG